MELQWLTADICRIKVPFSNIYTSVFVIRTGEGTVVFDTASKPSDIDGYIQPVMEQLGAEPDYVFISHNHNDHSGGLGRLVEMYPKIRILSASQGIAEQYGDRVVCPWDGQQLLGVLQAVFIPGHTPDAMALLDTRTGTLLSGDCLQAYGIFGAGPWGSAIRSVKPHFQAIEKLRHMDIRLLVTAHDYHPYKAVVGHEQIPAYLDRCMEAMYRIRDIMLATPGLTDEEYVELCNDGTLPRIDHRVIAGMRIAVEQRDIQI